MHGGQVIATTVTQADGTTDTWRYGADGAPIEHIDAQGQSTTWKYDSHKRMVEQKDPLGRITRHGYDSRSNRVQSIDALQRVTRMSYDGKWNTLASVTRYNDAAPLGQAHPQTSLLFYDSTTGVLKRSTDALSRSTTFDYTARGQLAQVTSAGGSNIKLEYNATGDLQRMIDPLGRISQLGVDAVGRPTQSTDPLGYTNATEYNAVDQVTKLTDPLGGTAKLSYDAAGRLQTVVNPLDKTIQTNTYDDGDRLKTQANALNQAAQNTYDSAGRLTQTTAPDGQVTSYGYDSGGRLVTITRPDGVTSLAHDVAGRLIRSSDAAGSLEYDYDAADRVTRHTQRHGTRVSTIDYQYDPLDRMVRRTVASTDTAGPGLPADVTEYAYDNANRLTKIVYKGGGSKNEQTLYEWDVDDRLTAKVLPNGIKATYQYDAAGQVKQIEYTNTGGTVIDRLQYTYDANGRIVQRDSLNNLSRDETPYTAVYDAADRLTSLTLHPGTGAQATFALSYDANGNLVQKRNTGNASDVTTYQWDSRNRLVALSAPGTVASFVYDQAGRRIRRTVNGQVTDYLYDGLQAVGEIRSGEVTVHLTGLALDEALARYTRTVATSAERGNVYLSDLLGSVIAQARADQSVQSRAVYSAYGEASASGDVDGNAIGYTGREDDQTGLYFYRARYYDSVLKRFISADPIGIEGGINVFAYVEGDPLTRVDPTGEFGIAGALGGAAVNAAVQFGLNYYAGGGSAADAAKCMDFRKVITSAAMGAVGPTLLGNKVIPVVASQFGKKAGVEFGMKPIAATMGTGVLLNTLTGMSESPPLHFFGADECECKKIRDNIKKKLGGMGDAISGIFF